MARYIYVVEKPFVDISIVEVGNDRMYMDSISKVHEMLKGKTGTVLVTRESTRGDERKVESSRFEVSKTPEGLTETKRTYYALEGAKTDTWYSYEQPSRIEFTKTGELVGKEIEITLKVKVIGESLDDYRQSYIVDPNPGRWIGTCPNYLVIHRETPFKERS